MSRIGKNPIQVPSGVTIEVKPGNVVHVKGPKGELTFPVRENITVKIENGVITLTRKSDSNTDKSLHGLSRTLIANMIQGVAKGFEKKLEIQGVGYRAQVQAGKLVLSLGYSHPIEFTPPKGVAVTVDAEKKNVLSVVGPDKQAVGEVAAKIRSFRKPEPYKGKGIRYLGEHVARKAGKAAAAGGKEK